ncbi:MAG: anti-sigma factor family protein [Chitinophagaceae bacterium]
MNCIEIEPLLIDYADQLLIPSLQSTVQKHLETCTHCREELSQYKQLFSELSSRHLEQPGPGLRENFNTMLQSELNIVSTVSLIKNTQEKKSNPVNLSRLVVRIAASIILVAGGLFTGLQLKPTPAPDKTTEIANLQKEVKEIKKAMLLTLLKEESASDRIRAVNYADEFNKPDNTIIYALFNTLNKDKNINVRLAAFNSIIKFSGDPMIIDSLVSSLGNQTEPLLQIVLINTLTDKKETKAIKSIKAILSNKKTLQPVKDIAEQGLRKVM